MEGLLFYGTMFLIHFILTSITIAGIVYIVRKILGLDKRNKR